MVCSFSTISLYIWDLTSILDDPPSQDGCIRAAYEICTGRQMRLLVWMLHLRHLDSWSLLVNKTSILKFADRFITKKGK